MVEEKPAHILIVEDDTFLAGIYKIKFELGGFRVTLAGDGEAGLIEAKKKLPDIILLDILLPKLDGLSVLYQLKHDRELSGIPVIILTNLGQKEDIEKGLALGAEDYLIKRHFQPAEIVKKVNQTLGRRHLSTGGNFSQMGGEFNE